MKEIISEDFKDALLLATDPDAPEEYFPAYVAPFWQDQKLVATDGRLMVAVDEELAPPFMTPTRRKSAPSIGTVETNTTRVMTILKRRSM